MWVFRKKYAVITIILLLVEIAIALFHFHPIVRGFLGDVLVVILLYTFLRTFLLISPVKIALGALLFAFTIEFVQILNPVEFFEIHSKILQTVIGSSFDPWDLVAYSIGFVFILLLEKIRCDVNKAKSN
ncbi:uncharacterized protein DUF2809 [Ulvibacter sp. MAR_2010_11]|uniref:ribosomal maturation YjgA family protein n=1 Tax=Ulvibacter sp. MAR_2010_11 TaxID=1250229 RepID=UPI000C2B6198|nr:DUF2809 domain-containing protein [Ulvibacter sp. MAR_2010_11]PKA83604.1 uncharacterized protein DUF2809 [Ulvibacter sp. MAR_2010_11]